LRIVFCTPGNIRYEDYAGGNTLGTESQVWGLAKELVKRGHETLIMRLWRRGSPSREEIEGVSVVNVPSWNFPDKIALKAVTRSLLSASMKKRLEALDPDVLVMAEYYSSLFTSRARIPKAFVMHNQPVDVHFPYNPLNRRLYKWAEKRVLRRSDVVIALSPYIRGVIQSMGLRSVYIPNGVDLSRYPPSQVDERFVLTGGRLVREKGLEYLIEAFSGLPEKTKNEYSLVVVGEGPEKEKLIERSRVVGVSSRVKFLPWIRKEGFIEMISRCSVYAFPSVIETFGIVQLEAMACGKPVVACEIPGPKDVITHGKDGLLSPARDVGGLRKNLETLLGDERLRRQMGVCARKTVEERYQFNRVAIEYENLFKSLLKP